jgi:hypothetical protein
LLKPFLLNTLQRFSPLVTSLIAMTKFVAFALVCIATAGEVKDWADKWSSALIKMGNIASSQGLSNSQEDLAKIFSDYTSLFASTGLDCACDPNNPAVGYSLQGATFLECVAADQVQLQKFGNLKMTNWVLVDTIVDEEDGKVSAWIEMTATSDRHPAPFKVRKALRMKIVHGKGIAYEMIWDTYNFMMQQGEEQQQMAAQAPATGTHMMVGAALFGCGVLVSQIFQKKKSNVLLQEYMVA